MVLTTNRTTAIDPAFESRIDITLVFTELTIAARREIWCNFLKGLSPPPSIDENGVQTLSEFPLNGRQIKSAIKSATVLAKSQGTEVTLRHLRVVLDLRMKAVKLLKPASTEMLD